MYCQTLNTATGQDLEGALISILGTGKGILSTPFQLIEKIRRELVRRAEVTGNRAMEWNMTSFDNVGGKGTLRSVWNRLNSSGMVKGRKRDLKPHKIVRVIRG